MFSSRFGVHSQLFGRCFLFSTFQVHISGNRSVFSLRKALSLHKASISHDPENAATTDTPKQPLTSYEALWSSVTLPSVCAGFCWNYKVVVCQFFLTTPHQASFLAPKRTLTGGLVLQHFQEGLFYRNPH